MKNLRFSQSFGGGGSKAPFIESLFTTHVANLAERLAFTLAEVLITLGIIGVVAALTMPNLVANYQKKVWVTQLKKTVSMLDNNFKRMMLEDGGENIFMTSFYEYNEYNTSEDCSIMNIDKYKDYFKLNTIAKNSEVLGERVAGNLGASYFLYSNDGACFAFSENGPWVYLDVNCEKGPNKSGRDRFAFLINTKGLVYKEAAGLSKDDCEYWANAEDEDADEATVSLYRWLAGGFACALKVIDAGWEMNY